VRSVEGDDDSKVSIRKFSLADVAKGIEEPRDGHHHAVLGFHLGLNRVELRTLHIFASLAEFERDLIRERTRAGLDAARRRGRVGGRQTVLTPAKERQARRMLAEGATKDEVAGVVGVSVSTLYRPAR